MSNDVFQISFSAEAIAEIAPLDQRAQELTASGNFTGSALVDNDIRNIKIADLDAQATAENCPDTSFQLSLAAETLGNAADEISDMQALATEGFTHPAL